MGGGGSGYGHGHDHGQGGQKRAVRWTKIAMKGDPTCQSPRGYHTGNVIGDTMVIIGSDENDCLSEDWLYLTLNPYIDKLQAEPGESRKLLAHPVTQVGSYLLIQGGHDDIEYISEICYFDLTVHLVYKEKVIFGKPSSARGCILADFCLFFGGYNDILTFGQFGDE